MRNRLKKIFKTIKKNDFNRIIVELMLLVSLFNLNRCAGLTMLLVVLFEMIITKKNENLLYIYLFLSFFDEVLIFDLVKGSISRIIMVLIFLKLGISILKNKIKPNKLQIAVPIFFLVCYIVGVITSGFDISSIIVLLNVFIFILFSMTIKLKTKKDINLFIEKLCFIIVFAVINGIFYGLLTNNFDSEVVNYETKALIYRFNGIYEPNFMCMYINLGILSLLTIKKKLNKIIYFIFIAIMFNAAILTASITGIATLSVSLLIYSFINIKNKNFNLRNLIIILLVTIVLFFGIKAISHKINENEVSGVQIQESNKQNVVQPQKPNNQESVTETPKEISKEQDKKIEKEEKSSLIQRFEKIIKEIKDGRLDKVTSGRLPLMRAFIKASFDRPILNILFGNGVTDKKIYCPFFDKKCYSHNSYLDFLYNFGVVGFTLTIGYLFYKTKNNYFLNQNILKSNYSSNIKIIRIMLLMYALSLTLYTKRMFLIFFLL